MLVLLKLDFPGVCDDVRIGVPDLPALVAQVRATLDNPAAHLGADLVLLEVRRPHRTSRHVVVPDFGGIVQAFRGVFPSSQSWPRPQDGETRAHYIESTGVDADNWNALDLTHLWDDGRPVQPPNPDGSTEGAWVPAEAWQASHTAQVPASSGVGDDSASSPPNVTPGEESPDDGA